MYINIYMVLSALRARRIAYFSLSEILNDLGMQWYIHVVGLYTFNIIIHLYSLSFPFSRMLRINSNTQLLLHTFISPRCVLVILSCFKCAFYGEWISCFCIDWQEKGCSKVILFHFYSKVNNLVVYILDLI